MNSRMDAIGLLWLISGAIIGTWGLNNGMARTPPMGWLSWAKFYCQTDCQHFPDACINEKLYTTMADLLVSEGYKDAGWNHVNVDDCWSNHSRDAQGRLQADSERFPHGIKWLADYMHSKGLKLGIYGDVGYATCAKYPGSAHYLQLDAETITGWGVDMWKFDGCNANLSWINYGYPAMSKYLNSTAHKLIYSCEWTLNQMLRKSAPNYSASVEFCNLDRNYNDIEKSWVSVQATIDFYDRNQDLLIPSNGPGHFNDPDMLVVGNVELTRDQSRAHLALWAMWSAPMFMSNDLRNIQPHFKEILLNRKVIAINQDPFGKMARLVANTTYMGAYVKPVVPHNPNTKETSFAVTFLNRAWFIPLRVSVRLAQLGLQSQSGYKIEDLFEGTTLGLLKPDDTFSTEVPPTGVVMIKATLASAVKY